MNLELDSIVWETICECLSQEGVSGELLDKAEDAIKYSLKETNYLHNSVADSNYYHAQEDKENKKVIAEREDKERLVKIYEDEIKALRYELEQARWKIYHLTNDK